MRPRFSARDVGLSAAALLGCVARAEPVVLRLSSWEGDEALRIQRKAVAEFEAAHPSVKVKIENNDFGAYFQKLLAQFASHTAPDVSMMTFERFQSFGKRAVLMPLDEMVKRDGVDLSDYYDAMIKSHSYQGKLYVLPRDIAPHGFIFYNRKIFREEGLAYPKTSWTWDYQERPELKEQDFLYVLRKLSKFGPDGKVVRWGGAIEANFLATTMALSQGARWADDDERPTKLLMDSPEWKRSMALALDLAYEMKYIPSISALASLQVGGLELFTQGKVAMMQAGMWDVPNIRRALKPGTKEFFDWDLTIMPAYKDGRRAFTTGGSGYAILATTAHPEEAWQLVKWLGGPKGMVGLAETGLAQPAMRSMVRKPPWLNTADTPETMRYPLSREIADEATNYVVFKPTFEAWPEVEGILGNRASAIWTREATAEEALRKGNEEAQYRLDTINRVERAPPFPWGVGVALGIALVVGAVAFVAWPEKTVGSTSRQRKTNFSAYKFLAPWIIGLFLFTLGPMVFSFLMSFSDWDMILPARARGVANYVDAFTKDPKFWVSLRVTGLYTFITVPLSLCTSLALALILNQKIKGMPIYRTCFYVPTVGSAVASALIWRKMLQPETGLINTLIYGPDGKGNFLGLATLLQPLVPPGASQVDWLGSERTALMGIMIMSLWGFGGVLVLLAGLQGIPHHYYEAATLDGANPRQKFRHVTLPLLSPAIFFSLVTGFIGSFQTFTQTYVLTGGGPNDATQFYMLNLYTQAFSSLRMGYASALAWILFFIVLVFTLLQVKGSRWVFTEGA